MLLLFFFASKRNATYVWNSLLYPTEFFNPLPRVCTDGRSTLTSKPNFLASTGMASRNIVMKKQYTLLWSALLWTSFWHRYVVSFLLRMGLRCVRFADADALLKGRNLGKYNKYLCKLENTDKSIFFSVKANFQGDIQNIFNRLLYIDWVGFFRYGISLNFENWWMETILFRF